MESEHYSELLIREVEKYPCLYDINSNDYGDRELKKNAWMAVAEKVAGEKWDQMDGMARSSVVQEVQSKWKNMKDTLMRSLRRARKGKAYGSRPRKPYIYRKQMAFLLDVYSQSRTLEYVKNYDGKVDTETNEAPSARACEPATVASSPKNRKTDPLEKEVSPNANAASQAPPARTSEPQNCLSRLDGLSRMPNNRMTNPFEKVVFGNMNANGAEANDAQRARAVVDPWMLRNIIRDPYGRQFFPNMIPNQGPVNNVAPTARTYEPPIVALSQMPNQIMTHPFEKGVFRNMNANGGMVNTVVPAARTYEPTFASSSRVPDPQANMGQQDADAMFLLSQLPSIKKMKTNDKLQFQLKFLQLVHTYGNTDENTALQTPSPVNSTFSSSSKTPSIPELDEDEDSVVSF